ncbi:MAG TPA: glycine cleavage T C-terminal barrel domain-containing protein [Myxococcota bacterium]|nr:glycine cleavage T C-terminal barrel domain-containing protein [Myxococcota bacterium]
MAELFEAVAGARAALRELPGRGLIRATGADRVRFLNGMLTADVAKLEPGAAAPALQLDRKGHVLADLWLLAEVDALWLDSAPGTEAELLAVLEKHVIADDVALASHSAGVRQWALEGPGARDAARAIGGANPPAGKFERADFAGASVLWLAGGSVSAEGLRALAPREIAAELARALALPPLDDAAAEVLRIAAAIPALGRDVTPRNFPQEARLERAISFTKGCYVGQEIVARIASRGAVNRVLVQLRTDALVAPGASVSVDGVSAGQVTSSAESAATGALALAYLKIEYARPGQRVAIDAVGGEVAGGDSRL